MTHDHSSFHKEKMVGNLIQAEDHLQGQHCPECLPTGSLIYGNPKPITIEDIAVGDKVLTHKGTFEDVTKTFKRHYNGNMIKIKPFFSNMEMRLTPEHPVFVANNIKTKGSWIKEFSKKTKVNFFKWKKAKHITENDVLLFPRMSEIKDVKEIELIEKREKHNVKVDNELCRLIGLYLAEGSIYSHKRGKTITFSFAKKENNLINFTLRKCHKFFGVIPSVNIVKTAVNISIFKTHIAEFFEQFGKGSLNKQIPSWMMFLPYHKQFSLLNGIIEGDGTILKHCIGITTKSQNMLFQLRIILFRLGLINSIYEQEHKDTYIEGRLIKPNGNVYNLRISGHHAKSLAKKLNLKYKGGKSVTGSHGYLTQNYVFIPIRNISNESYNGMVFNMEVKNNNSYSCPSCVVHNCEDKHLRSASAYMEEEVSHNPEGADPRLLLLAQKVRNIRRELQEMEGIKHDNSQDTLKRFA